MNPISVDLTVFLYSKALYFAIGRDCKLVRCMIAVRTIMSSNLTRLGGGRLDHKLA